MCCDEGRHLDGRLLGPKRCFSSQQQQLQNLLINVPSRHIAIKKFAVFIVLVLLTVLVYKITRFGKKAKAAQKNVE